MKQNSYKLIKIDPISAPNFTMNVLEFNRLLPEDVDFKIVRTYWLNNPKEAKKSGLHAHTDEDEIFIVLSGSTTIILDTGKGIEKIKMSTNDAIWLPRYIWHGFEEMSDDAMIIALTNVPYDPKRSGYIEDYEKFKEMFGKPQ